MAEYSLETIDASMMTWKIKHFFKDFSAANASHFTVSHFTSQSLHRITATYFKNPG